MVLFKINEKKIELKVYDLDSVETIIIRLAARLNTIPDFIYFPNDVPDIDEIAENKYSEIEIINLVDLIKASNNILSLYESLEQKLPKSVLTLSFLFQYFIVLSEKKIEYKAMYDQDFTDNIIDSLKNDLNKIDSSFKIDVKKLDYIISEGDKYFNDKVVINKKKSLHIIEKFEEFNKIEGVYSTNFELSRVEFELELDIPNISSLLEIFNNIVLTPVIPFAVTHNFYKIYKDFIPFLSWGNLFDRSTNPFNKYKNIERNNNIILKLLEKTSNIITEKNYTEIIINIREDISSNRKVIVKFNYNINAITKDELLEYFFNILQVNNTNIKNEKKIGVKGQYYLPKLEKPFNKELLLDIIMNNNDFSNIIYVNENKLSKRNNVYIHFNNPIIGNVTASITGGIVKPKNYKLLNKNKVYFIVESEYMLIKITKAENETKVKYFQNILGKLIEIYNKEYDKILREYKKFLDFNEEQKYEDEEDEDVPEETEELLAAVDRNIFVSNYSRFCPENPTYITEEEVETAEEEGKKILTFPKEKVGTSEPKKFICNHKDYKYPGLKENSLENKNIFPYLPCCYLKNHFKNKGSIENYYYHGKPLKSDTEIQKRHEIYVSSVILPNTSLGILPLNIKKIFFVKDIEGLYYRRGVLRTKNSFINCVLEALIDEEITNDLLNDTRVSFATKKFACSCKQELYDYTTSEIIYKIKNLEEYFDPKLFIRLIEIKYKCNIFIFSKNNNGELILPRHLEHYYKRKNKNKCIFIYEHMGAKSDSAEYPQCELIIKDNEDSLEATFDFESDISQNIFRLFNTLNQGYIFNYKIPLNDFGWPWDSANIKLDSQVIDTYGKTRSINILYKDDIKVSLLTNPIQPLKLIETKEIYKTVPELALEIFREINVENIKQYIDSNDNIIKIQGLIHNTKIEILIENNTKKMDKIEFIKDKELININFKNKESVISSYNKYKKYTRYIIEYLYWLYSNYIFENNINEQELLDENILLEFRKKHILIKTEYKYKKVYKMFDKDSGLTENGFLILKSEETLKRIFYVLRLEIIRNRKKIINYYKKELIENYYIDISDFNNNKFQVILEGENSIYKWILEKTSNNEIYNKIYFNDRIKHDEDEDKKKEKDEKKNKKEKVLEIEPYFFQNDLISNKIFIAQNTDSIEKAIEISKIWKEKNINIGFNASKSLIPYEINLYSYTNSKNIDEYIIEGHKNNLDINIIGYKIKDTNYFTSLLPI